MKVIKSRDRVFVGTAKPTLLSRARGKTCTSSPFESGKDYREPATAESVWFLMFYNDTTLFVTNTRSCVESGEVLSSTSAE